MAAFATSSAASFRSIDYTKQKATPAGSREHSKQGIGTMLDRRALLTSSLAIAAVSSLPGIACAAPMAPFKLYDTHTHLYSSDLEKYPYRPDIAAAAKTRTLARPMTPEVLLKMFDEGGVEMGCGVQYNTTYYTDNSFLLDSADQYPK